MRRLAHRDNHQRATLIAVLQRVLQQSRELAFSVRNCHRYSLTLATFYSRGEQVLLLIAPIGKNSKYPSKSCQVLVNELALSFQVIGLARLIGLILVLKVVMDAA